MTFKIKWDTVPTYDIEVGTLNAPAEIMDFFKKQGITRYVYRIKYKDIVIKYGMSAPKAISSDPGERVYRQVAHVASWDTQQIRGSSGADWVYIEMDFKKSYNHDIDHRYISIKVYDFTNYKFESVRPQDEVYYAEQQLIHQYSELVGNKPIGNVNDTTTLARFEHKAHIKVSLWDTLFGK
jgi:hypothetical protein